MPKPAQYTKAALRRKALLKKAHIKQLEKAVRLVADDAGGAAKVVGMVFGCSRSQITTAVLKANLKQPWRAAFFFITSIGMERHVNDGSRE